MTALRRQRACRNAWLGAAGLLGALLACSEAERELINHGNAERLLGI